MKAAAAEDAAPMKAMKASGAEVGVQDLSPHPETRLRGFPVDPGAAGLDGQRPQTTVTESDEYDVDLTDCSTDDGETGWTPVPSMRGGGKQGRQAAVLRAKPTATQKPQSGGKPAAALNDTKGKKDNDNTKGQKQVPIESGKLIATHWSVPVGGSDEMRHGQSGICLPTNATYENRRPCLQGGAGAMAMLVPPGVEHEGFQIFLIWVEVDGDIQQVMRRLLQLGTGGGGVQASVLQGAGSGGSAHGTGGPGDPANGGGRQPGLEEPGHEGGAHHGRLHSQEVRRRQVGGHAQHEGEHEGRRQHDGGHAGDLQGACG